MIIRFTNRGFAIGEFEDRYGTKCSIQESSLATEACIWLGQHHCDKPGCETPTRMHLTQDMAAELIPLLQHFVDTGSLPSPPNESEEKT